MHLARGLGAAWLTVAVCQAATELASDGATLFRAEASVTFGAVYSERVTRATVVCAVPTTVSIRTGKAPRNVFLGQERLAVAAWSFDAQTGLVTLTVPGGTALVEVRFDDVADLKPFTASVPVVLVTDREGTGLRVGTAADAGRMEVTVAAESVRGSLAWPGPEGLFSVEAIRERKPAAGVRLTTSAATGVDGSLLLLPGTVLLLSGEAPGQKVPVDRIECSLRGAVAALRSVDKAGLAWDGSTTLEAEAFKAEGGGTVSRSSEHAGIHGGGCVFSWGAPGHWLSWEVTVPADGVYVLTLLAATQETEALRGIRIDGAPVPASVLRFPGTGGWGRTKAEEWQAVQPVDGQGSPMRIPLKAGVHEVRMTNLFGQHLNLDCFLLTPAP